MSWLSFAAITIAAGASIAEISGSVDISSVNAGDALLVGNNTPVEIRATTTQNGNPAFELEVPWAASAVNGVGGYVMPTRGDFNNATQAVREATTLALSVLQNLGDYVESDDPTFTVTDAAGNQYIRNTLAENQRTIDGMVATIDTTMDGRIDSRLAGAVRRITRPTFNFREEMKSGLLNIRRSSGATYFDKSGDLKYSPSPIATNEQRYSEDVTQWSNNATNCFPRLGGYYRGMRWNILGENSVNGDHGARDIALSLTDELVLISCFVMPLRREWVRLIFRDASNNRAEVGFNVTNGELGNNTLIGGFEVVDTFSDYQGDGVYRIGMLVKDPVPGSINQFRILPAIGPSNTDGSYAGEDDVDSIQITGVQVEQGVRVPSGYVKTGLTAPLSGFSYRGINQNRTEKEGELIEGESTNLVDDIDPSTANYSESGVINSGVHTSGYGEIIPMWSITESTANEVKYRRCNGIDYVAGSVYCFSAIIEVGSKSRISLVLPSSVFGSTIYTTFDLSGDGSVLTSNALSNGFKRLKEGVYRVWIAATATATATGIGQVQLIEESGTSGTYIGDGVSNLAVGGFQVEENRTRPSSLIMSNGSPLTRARDLLKVSSKNRVPDPAGPWTLFFEYVHNSELNAYYRLFEVGTGASTVRFYVYTISTIIFLTNGVAASAISCGGLVDGEKYLIAFSHDGAGNYTGYNNGALSNQNSDIRDPVEFLHEDFYIGCGNSAANDGYLNHREMQFFDTELNAAEIQLLCGGGV